MTAEIAILNRSAVALAADSVATVITPSALKRFDFAEKIFEATRAQPIAIMIYNNAEFMNTPLDVLIRKFRTDKAAQKPPAIFPTVEEAWKSFEKYLMGFERTEADEQEHFKQHVREVVGRIARNLERRARQDTFSGKKPKWPDYDAICLDEIQQVKDEAIANPLQGFLDGIDLASFTAEYGSHVEDVVGDRFSPTIAALPHIKNGFNELMYHVIKSTDQSEGFTGFVVAGFGRDELFPALTSVESDGIYFGKLRILQEDRRAIDRQRNTSEIVGFAQREMPERFIFGIDEEMEDSIARIAEGILDTIADQKRRTFQAPGGAAIIDSAKRNFRRGLLRLRLRAEAKVKSMVDFMSKKDLGEMAYSLVELTSRKRRFSDEEESVGGPIDVAILTKNEGFVWIRRKHYFDKEANPGYFRRAFGKGELE